MKRIRISPFLPVVFFLAFLSGHLKEFSLLYLLIFLHEGAHFLAALALHMKPESIHLLPWGCMLSLSKPPCGKKSALVFLAGPLFNLALGFLGVLPRENLLLAFFNLLPVMPLDGGMILSLFFPKASFAAALVTEAALLALSFALSLPPILPFLLIILTLSERRKKRDRELAAKICNFLLK